MNYLQKQQIVRNLKNSFIANYPRGCCKIVGNVSNEHEVTKASVMHWFEANGYDTYSEITFKSPYSGRGDIVAIHPSGFGYICEILKSESEKRFNSKKDKYPEEFMLIKVVTKDYSYDTFKV